jgi:hypothetical protein
LKSWTKIYGASMVGHPFQKMTGLNSRGGGNIFRTSAEKGGARERGSGSGNDSGLPEQATMVGS